MRSKEELKAIEIVKQIEFKDLLDSWDAEENYNAIQIVLNLIEKQQKEIEYYKNKYEQEQMKEQDMINQIQQLEEETKEEYEQILEDYYNEY